MRENAGYVNSGHVAGESGKPLLRHNDDAAYNNANPSYPYLLDDLHGSQSDARANSGRTCSPLTHGLGSR
jgi:hypothetical protein